jgi:hypothetical protein
MIFAVSAALAATIGFASVAAAEPTSVTLCTGSSGFPYNQAGKMIASQANGSANVRINVVESAGSLDNIRRSVDVVAGEPDSCDAFIGQPDAVVLAKRANKSLPVKQVGQLHREYLQVLCNKESGVDDIEDLPGGKDSAGNPFTVNIGKEGSGAWAIWQNFIAEDASYKDVPTMNEPDNIALGSVSSGETTCMIIAAGLNNSTMQEANDNLSDSVVMAEATDWDFNDAKDIRGKPLYEFIDIPRTYKNLQGFFGGKRETVSWLAGVYINPEKFQNEKALGDFIKYMNRAKASIVSEYGN